MGNQQALIADYLGREEQARAVLACILYAISERDTG